MAQGKLRSQSKLILFALVCLVPLYVLFLSRSAHASSVSYHGRILKPDNTPVQDLNVEFKVQIRTPGSENCLLFEETITAPVLNGVFSLAINGSGTRTDAYSATRTFDQALTNQKPFSFNSGDCTMGSTYSPQPGDGRSISVHFKTSSMGTFESLTPMALNWAPIAIEAKNIAGYGSGNILKVDIPDSRTTLSAAQLAEIVNLSNGISTNFVRMSGSGGAMIPSTPGNPSSPSAGSIWYDSVTNQLKYSNGTATPVVLGSSSGGGGGISMLNNQSNSTQTFGTIALTGASNPLWNSSGGVHTLTIPMAATTGVGAGLISQAQFDTFNSKLTSVLPAGNIFVGSSSGVATAVTPSGDVSFAANGATTLSAIHGQAVDATLPTLDGQVLRWNATDKWKAGFLSLADIRSTAMPTNTIFPSSSCPSNQALNWSSLTDTFACTNITLSSAQLYGSAISAGYVFAGPATGVGAPSFRALVASDLPAGGGGSSQWTTSGANIYYSGGGVGVGTTTPVSTFHLVKSSGGSVAAATNRALIVQDDAGSGDTLTVDFIGGPTGAVMLNFGSRLALAKGQIFYNNTSNAMAFLTNGTQKMAIDASGNIGVGTATAGAILDLYGTSASNSALIVPRASLADRPVGANGMIRYNTDSQKFEAFGNSAWAEFATVGTGGGSGYLPLSGGTMTGDLNLGGRTLIGDTANNGNVTVESNSSPYKGKILLNPSGGTVGIGTTSPSATFDVYGNVNSEIKVSNSSTYGSLKINATGTSLSHNSGSNSVLQIDANAGASSTSTIQFFRNTSTTGAVNVDFLRGNGTATPIDHRLQSGAAGVSFIAANGGRLGVGTATPTAGAALEISGAGTGASSILLPRDGTSNRPAGVNGMIRYNSDLQKFEGFAASAWSTLAMVGSGGASAGQWSTSGSDLYYGAGKVGIGTSTPASLLQVGDVATHSAMPILNLYNLYQNLGGGLLQMQTDESSAFDPSNPSSYIQLRNSYLTNGAHTSVGFKPGDARAYIVGSRVSANNSKLSLWSDSAGVLKESLSVVGERVGIGTSSPQQNLDVVGTIQANNIKPIYIAGTAGGGPEQWVPIATITHTTNQHASFVLTFVPDYMWNSDGGSAEVMVRTTTHYSDGPAAEVYVSNISAPFVPSDFVLVRNGSGYAYTFQLFMRLANSWRNNIFQPRTVNGTANVSFTNAAAPIAALPSGTQIAGISTGFYFSGLSAGGTGVLTKSIAYTDGNVGIGTAAPATSLDVNGGIRAGSETVVTATCNSTNEGVQRYNKSVHLMEFCDGTAWVQIPKMVAGTTTPVTAIGAPASANIYTYSTGTATGYTPNYGSVANTYDLNWPVNNSSNFRNTACVDIVPGASFITFDLGSVKSIGNLYFSASLDVVLGISFSTDGTNFITGTNVHADGPGITYKQVTLGTPTSAQYIRVSNANSQNPDYADLCEFHVGP